MVVLLPPPERGRSGISPFVRRWPDLVPSIPQLPLVAWNGRTYLQCPHCLQAVFWEQSVLLFFTFGSLLLNIVLCSTIFPIVAQFIKEAFTVSTDHFLLSEYQEGGEDSCKGDSGSALVVSKEDKVVRIHLTLCTPNPTYYTPYPFAYVTYISA